MRSSSESAAPVPRIPSLAFALFSVFLVFWSRVCGSEFEVRDRLPYFTLIHCICFGSVDRVMDEDALQLFAKWMALARQKQTSSNRNDLARSRVALVLPHATTARSTFSSDSTVCRAHILMRKVVHTSLHYDHSAKSVLLTYEASASLRSSGRRKLRLERSHLQRGSSIPSQYEPTDSLVLIPN